MYDPIEQIGKEPSADDDENFKVELINQKDRVAFNRMDFGVRGSVSVLFAYSAYESGAVLYKAHQYAKMRDFEKTKSYKEGFNIVASMTVILALLALYQGFKAKMSYHSLKKNREKLRLLKQHL